IRKARKKGMLPDVRVDATESCMMRGEEAYRQYLETEGARKEREAEQAARARRMGDPQTAAIEAFKQEGEQTIRQIRLANDAIPGEEISEKLAKLEKTTARIFDYVEQHPEKLPDTRKFLSYYLPTTLKLVEKYRQYDEMEPQPAAVVKAKAEIEATLDTIDVAFNNLLESLYHEDTLDVATDIRVLEQMLEQEGLTKKQFELDAD
ncbi:MAG: 5-bromo-4-chloroindolyl phosphate hydrolysis family protein, partial [Oscillospiraceae bacterium]